MSVKLYYTDLKHSRVYWRPVRLSQAYWDTHLDGGSPPSTGVGVMRILTSCTVVAPSISRRRICMMRLNMILSFSSRPWHTLVNRAYLKWLSMSLLVEILL